MTRTTPLAQQCAAVLDLSAQWDRAADALARGDNAGFDREMARFRAMNDAINGMRENEDVRFFND